MERAGDGWNQRFLGYGLGMFARCFGVCLVLFFGMLGMFEGIFGMFTGKMVGFQ